MNRFKGKPRLFRGKKIAVIGAGAEGLSSAKFLNKNGADVTILDEQSNLDPKIIGSIKKLKIELELGKNYLDSLSDFEVIVRSPGIKLNIKELEDARKKGIEITSQIKLFFELCPAKIIGITGTKGKGTTSALIYEILKKQGLDAYLGGNIGVPPLDFLDKLNPQSLIVLELSSFQLQDLSKSPYIAVILMMTSEHLAPDKKEGLHQNYHETVEEYINAKRNILRFQTGSDFVIVNIDYPASRESDVHAMGKIYQISRENEIKKGCYIKDGKVVISIPKGRFNKKTTEIIDVEDILLPGRHNLENVCAAAMTAALFGVSKENIVQVLKTFKGLEHRLELVSEINGVKYYDDSFSTTPETAIAAIHAFKSPEILILGGSSKNSNFKELGRVIRDSKNIKAIIGIGEEWKKIKSQIQNLKSQTKIIEGCGNMKEIIEKAASISKSGDIILLTPACSSFDMFKNYKDRGDQFKEEVRKLLRKV